MGVKLPVSLTYDQVVRSLRRLADANPDHVDPDAASGSLCVNFKQGEPSCIVGHLLAEFGITENQLGTGGTFDSATELAEKVISVDTDTVNLLQRVQTAQDCKDPWGLAVYKNLPYEEGGARQVQRGEY